MLLEVLGLRSTFWCDCYCLQEENVVEKDFPLRSRRGALGSGVVVSATNSKAASIALAHQCQVASSLLCFIYIQIYIKASTRLHIMALEILQTGSNTKGYA